MRRGEIQNTVNLLKCVSLKYKNMKTLIICDSVHHGNTRKIADVFAKELDGEVVTSAEITEIKMREYGLVGFGSGIYRGNHYERLINFVGSLLPNQDASAFIFSTSGFGEILMEKQHRNLRYELQKKDFRILDEFSCKGYSNFGPLKLIGGINKGRPGKKDFERARDFAKGLKEKV